MTDLLNPYAALYTHPNGPGDQRPTALQVVRDNNRIGNLTGKLALVTGATSGIGIETVRTLYATGATLYITAREMKKAKTVVDDIRGTDEGSGHWEIEFVEMDMESLESVKGAAADFLRLSGGRLNLLVNNAGIMTTPELKSADDHELQLAVNHLAHSTLTTNLLPALLASSTPPFNSRIIFLSSSPHRYSSIHWSNLNLTAEYDPYTAYGQSKTANLWTANHVDRLYGDRGVHALAVNPGRIWTGLQKAATAE